MYHPTTRVLTVLELLQAHDRLTGVDLAERLEMSPRTVRRYITMLQDLGLPIEGERGRYGAYRLRPGFKLPPLMFTEDEALALTLGLLAARRLGLVVEASSVAGALAKVERVMPVALRARVQAVQATLVLEDVARDVSPSGEVVVTLASAALERRRVILEYQAWDGTATSRSLDPYGLVYRSGRWYVVGHCYLRHGLRVFRLDRVLSATICDETFEQPPLIDSLAVVERSIASTPGRWPVEVLLKTSMEDARCKVPAAMAALEEMPDGIVLRCHVQDLTWFAQLIASLGCSFVVRQPQELRVELRKVAQQILESVEVADED